MSFFDYLQVIGSALVVAVCVFLIKNPINLEEATVQVTPMAFALAYSERRSMSIRPSCQSTKAVTPSSSVAGAQQIKTIPSIVTTSTDIEMTEVASAYAEISEVVSVEIEMMDAPIPQLKSCLKSSAFRSARSVRFVGPSDDCIRGRVFTHVVSEMKSFHEEYMATSGPHVSFPLTEETDLEGNATGWFSKQDSIYFPPKVEVQGDLADCEAYTTCATCRGNLSYGFLDPIVDYPDSVLEAEDIWALNLYVSRDVERRYHCRSHGGD
ncbi:hypothetical protein NHQ30_005725 [Ciborinia camelliae]|nr:hypothetical protein NHQ30_005725 [Ciborinia camelliae]